ncbi:MAG: hypothetical protein Q9213_006321 [Squamulea squamosa]
MVMNTRTKQYWNTPNCQSGQNGAQSFGILTLNHVNPLRGVLQKLPQHFAAQLRGHTHGFGLIPRK